MGRRLGKGLRVSVAPIQPPASDVRHELFLCCAAGASADQPHGISPTVHHRGVQREAVIKAVRGDTLVSLPTGCGKTLVMAILPFVLSVVHSSCRLVVIVSPLLSLIHLQAVVSGQTKLLYMTAETFISKAAQGLLRVQFSQLLRHSAVLVDEAHQAYEWTTGDSAFRVAYAQLHGHIPRQSHVVLLSGTLTCKVVEALKASLFPGRDWSQ
ncbi:hypothetical protein B484DRAFT_402194, partial [Ochromonadaceae sp. CCMP2298]